LVEMAVKATTSMEMAPGALPHPCRVPKQRLLSPEIHRWRWWSCGTSFGKWPIHLGFSVGRLYIGGEAASGGGPGGHTPWWRRPGLGRAALGCVRPLAPLHLIFGLHDASGKIGGSAFVSSNSENISCVAFLKHKNNRK
jgi:hypothetical protein